MFLNRQKEIERIQQSLQRKKPQFIVIYGRRRCGKSTLLQQILPHETIYFSADLRETPLQISAFARQVEKTAPGFSKPVYPDWETLFLSLNNTLKERTIVCIDEFPYLVKNSPELQSVLQKIIDNRDHCNFHLILCGSSQQMMYSMVLEKTSPLYGRCDEIIKLKPMAIRYLQEYLSVSSVDAVREFGVWGGVPRYWEVRKQHENLAQAVKNSILDQNGLLSEEPERLFSDELRTAVQAYSILSLIGAGVHRPSEIAARLGKPATQLSRVLGFLVNQGYIKRETPYGEPPKSSKKSLYKMDDPFMNFYFTFLVPNKSRLEFNMVEQVWEEIENKYDRYISSIWEDLCRKAIPFIEIEGKRFNPASRWWGGGLNKKKMEIDLIASSTDQTAILIGEVKWSDKNQTIEVLESLKWKESNIPFAKPEKIIKVLFQKTPASHPDITVLTPDDIVSLADLP
jgi:AAA+ ATPase superfamily predicted ATPase